MKLFRILTFVALFLASSLSVLAQDTVYLDPNQLPRPAKLYIRTYFPYYVPAEARMVDNHYEVMMTDRSTMEFDKAGQWTMVKCEDGIPHESMPYALRMYLFRRFASRDVIRMQRRGENIELEFSSGMIVLFDSKAHVMNVK